MLSPRRYDVRGPLSSTEYRENLQAGHDALEGARDLVPGEVCIDHFPGCGGDARTGAGVVEEVETLIGERLRRVGEADILGRVGGQTFSAYGGAHNRDLRRHGLVDFQA